MPTQGSRATSPNGPHDFALDRPHGMRVAVRLRVTRENVRQFDLSLRWCRAIVRDGHGLYSSESLGFGIRNKSSGL